MTKRYTPSLHAIERAGLRFGVPSEKATQWFNDLMTKSRYLLTQKVGGKTQTVYECEGKQLVVDAKNNVIVTIKPVTSVASPIVGTICKTVEREFRKLHRQFTRDSRALNIELAEINVEIAQLGLNKARAKSPKVQACIQAKIDALAAQASEVKTKLDRLADDFEQVRRSASAWMD